MSHADSPAGRTVAPQASPRGDERGELDLYDLVELAWAQRVLIILVFAVLFAVGAGAAIMLIKPSYEAQARLLLILDDADPTPGTAGAGGAFVLDQVLQSETEILNSDAVRRLAIAEVGIGSLLPDGGTEADALKMLRDGFSVSRAPNAAVLVPTFEHGDAEIAALAVNGMVNAYLEYRRQVLVGDGTETAARQVTAVAALVEAQSALDTFLNANGLTNYTADVDAAVTRVQTLRTALDTAEAERAAALAGIAALNERLAGIPESIEEYVENDAGNQLLQREALLARYQPEAPPVQAIDRQIAAVESFIATGGAEGLGQRRVGANPVRQDLETQLLTLQSTAAAEQRRITTLNGQISAAQAEVSRMRALNPEFRELAQEVSANEEALSLIATQQVEGQNRRAAALGAADTVRVLEYGAVPPEGSSLKKVAVIAAFMFAAGVAVLTGLLWGFWSRHLRSPSPRGGRRFNVVGTPATAPQPVRTNESSGIPILARVSDRGSFAQR
mgnify:CR=1 FL=1